MPTPIGVIAMFTGLNINVPSGWTRETSLDGRFPYGASSGIGATGGSTTHSHSVDTHTHTNVSHYHVIGNIGYGGTIYATGSGNAVQAAPGSLQATVAGVMTTLNSASGNTTVNANLPAYRTVIFIRNTAQTDLSTSEARWFAVSGGTHDTNFSNVFPMGAPAGNNAGATGGSATHTHTASASHTSVSHTHNGTAYCFVPGVSVYTGSGSTAFIQPFDHYHTANITTNASTHGIGCSGSTTSTNHEPPFYTLRVVSQTGDPPVGTIGIWLGSLSSIPLGWALCDGTAGTPNLVGRFIKGSSTAGSTGGSTSHAHSSISLSLASNYTENNTHSFYFSLTHNAGGNTILGATGSAVQAETFSSSFSFGGSITTVYASGDAATVNASSVSHLPPYIQVAFIQKTANNTPPTVSGVTATYASGRTRTGPNTTWGVSFTPSDAEQTGANALQYRVTNSGTIGGGGTVYASGNCTSGSPVNISGLSYSLLSEGNNTLYVHVFDGGLWSAPVSFTVSRDSTISAPTGISHTPSPVGPDKQYSVTFNAPDTTSTNANEMRWEVRTAANGGGTLVAFGNFTQGNGRNTGTFTDNSLVNGANTRYLRIYDGAWNAAETSFTVTAQLEVPVSSSENAAINTTETPGIAVQLFVTSAENAAVNTAETPALAVTQYIISAENAAVNTTEGNTLDVTLYVSAAENAKANTTEAPFVDAAVSAAENAKANTAETETLAGYLNTAENAAANTAEMSNVDVIGVFEPRHLRVDVYDVDGTQRLGRGPIVDIIPGAAYSARINELGQFRFAIPATHPDAGIFAPGRQVWIYRESEGLVFKGIIAAVNRRVESGAPVLDVSGYSLAAQLVYRSALLNRSYQLATVDAIVSDLLAGSGWARDAAYSAPKTLTVDIQGLSIWAAMSEVAKRAGVYVREDYWAKKVAVAEFGEDSGLIWLNLEQLAPELLLNDSISIVKSVTEFTDGSNIVNKIIPLGAGEGNNRLDLRYATKNSPYTIQTGTLPDGSTYWYLADAASIAQYGERTRVIAFKNIAPVETTTTGFINAANTLYEAAAAVLRDYAQPIRVYSAEVIGLRHLDPETGAPRFRLGERVRLRYRGLMTDESGATSTWLDIDEPLWILGWERSFDRSGADSWRIDVASAAVLPKRTDAEQTAQIISDIRAIEYNIRPYNFERVDGPFRGAANASYPLVFSFEYDATIAYLLRAKLRFTIRPLRTNATGAASGGGTSTTTSSGGGTSTTTGAGGGTTATSSSGAAHSHTINATTTGDAPTTGVGIQGHLYPDPTVSLGPNPASTQLESNSHQHYVWSTPSWSDANASNHSHSLNNHTHVTHASYSAYITISEPAHTHSITSQTSSSESSHTHSVTLSDHTHNVTIPDHTHNLTLADHTHAIVYGVFEAAAPSNPRVNIIINGVNRTAALGGGTGWNTGQLLDITQYLTEADLQPIRQVHTIQLQVQELCDLEVVLRSTVTAYPI